jgi:hypothetical protein
MSGYLAGTEIAWRFQPEESFWFDLKIIAGVSGV